MNKRTSITISILFLICIQPTSAGTYRWVDENGVTIYSQSPPPSGKATKIKTPPPSHSSKPGDTLKKLKDRLEALEKDKKKKSAADEKDELAARNAEISKQNCNTAKRHLSELKQSARVKMKMEDGNYKILSEEEKNAQMEKAQAGIKKFCK